jgi:DNA-binding IclR family transcriptional regulator
VQTAEIQSRILQLLKETGGAEPATLSEKLRITPSDLEREVATLRHMEKVRAGLREGRKAVCLW